MTAGIHHAPLYQVDFGVQATGKTIGGSKRKIRFRFGYANPEALAQGGVGVECRGEEHEVLCVWSVSSGKKVVLLDGKEVYQSVPKGGGGFLSSMECNFSFAKHHIIKLVAHSVPPGYSNGMEQRQYDLFLDGLSYFEFSKLYELGREKKVIGRKEIRALVTSTAGGDQYNNYTVHPSPHSVEAFREDYVTQAPSFAKPPMAPTPPRTNVTNAAPAESNKAPEPELIDFLSESIPATVQVPAPVVAAAPLIPASSASVYSACSNTYEPAFFSPSASTFSVPLPTPSPMFGSAPSPAPFVDYTSVSTQQTLPYQQYQQQVTQYDILSKYNDKVANPEPNYVNRPEENSTALVPFTPAKLTMEPVNPFDSYVALPAHQPSEDYSKQDQLCLAMKKLVNFDNIRDESEAKQLEKLSAKPSLYISNNTRSSLPLNQVKTNYVNPNASLAEIQASKVGQPQRQSVMVAPPQPVYNNSGYQLNPMAGAMSSSYGSNPAYGQTFSRPQPQSYTNYQFAH
jgi:hypothetical protein